MRAMAAVATLALAACGGASPAITTGATGGSTSGATSGATTAAATGSTSGATSDTTSAGASNQRRWHHRRRRDHHRHQPRHHRRRRDQLHGRCTRRRHHGCGHLHREHQLHGRDHRIVRHHHGGRQLHRGQLVVRHHRGQHRRRPSRPTTSTRPSATRTAARATAARGPRPTCSRGPVRPISCSCTRICPRPSMRPLGLPRGPGGDLHRQPPGRRLQPGPHLFWRELHDVDHGALARRRRLHEHPGLRERLLHQRGLPARDLRSGRRSRGRLRLHGLRRLRPREQSRLRRHGLRPVQSVGRGLRYHSSFCANGLACIGNTCATLPVVAGNPCLPSGGECVAGSYCFATAGLTIPVSCATQVALGHSCGADVAHLPNVSGADLECAGGQAVAVCVGAGTLKDGGFASGICRAASDVDGGCTPPARRLTRPMPTSTAAGWGSTACRGPAPSRPAAGLAARWPTPATRSRASAIPRPTPASPSSRPAAPAARPTLTSAASAGPARRTGSARDRPRAARATSRSQRSPRARPGRHRLSACSSGSSRFSRAASSAPSAPTSARWPTRWASAATWSTPI